MFKFIQKAQAYLALRAKCNEADAKHRIDGKRYFVIPVHGTLQTVNIEEALTLKKQGVLPADFSNKLIYNIAYYWSDTSSRHASSKGAMPKFEKHRRRPYFYKWFFSHHH